MTAALLYQPKQDWRIGIAFVAAALIHFAAVAIASMDHRVPVEVTSSGDLDIPIDYLLPDPPAENTTPPPEDVTAPTPVPVPVEKPLFAENSATPPPVRPQISKPAAPIAKARIGVTSGAARTSSIRAMALSGPHPVYPYEARRQKLTGSGVAMMTVDPVSGNVTGVMMQESTGSSVLDNAAVAAFRKWRFKAGTGPRVISPITFTLTGAQY